MTEYAVASIQLWGQSLGAVAEGPDGRITFEFAESFRRSGLEVSPIHLPLATRGPIEFPALQRVESFAGLPGLLADSLPDAFGNAVIRRYFEQRGTPDAALSPVQKLLYIGSRAMGALEFHPAIERRGRAADEALKIAELVAEARRVIAGDPTVAVPEMMQLGASAGGARAKALVHWNPAEQRLSSAFAPAGAGDEPWLLKFDGVSTATGGPVAAASFQPGPYGRIEAAYAEVARRAGIAMQPTYLLHERDFAHFMTQRFDRVGAERLHMHTLGGLHHIDYNIRQALSYEDYFRTIRRLGMGQPEVDEAYRRMVFNVAARNQDDHVKNVAFLMVRDGVWRLAPAFDLTWSLGGRWAATHQMTVSGKDDHFSRDDLLGVGSRFDVAHDGARILDAVMEELAQWPARAREVGLGPDVVTQVAASFRDLR